MKLARNRNYIIQNINKRKRDKSSKFFLKKDFLLYKYIDFLISYKLDRSKNYYHHNNRFNIYKKF